MKNFLLSLVCFGALVSSAFAQGAKGTSAQSVRPQDVYGSFTALLAPGQTPALLLVSDASLKPGGVNPGLLTFYTPKFDTVQAFVTGAPTTCTYRVYGTLKLPAESPVFPTDYQDLSGALDCTAAAGQMVHIYYKPVVSVVISLTALTGGTAPAVQFRYLAVH